MKQPSIGSKPDTPSARPSGDLRHQFEGIRRRFELAARHPHLISSYEERLKTLEELLDEIPGHWRIQTLPHGLGVRAELDIRNGYAVTASTVWEAVATLVVRTRPG
jgi:hypothetical protein